MRKNDLSRINYSAIFSSLTVVCISDARDDSAY